MVTSLLFAILVAFALSTALTFGVAQWMPRTTGDRARDIHDYPITRYGGIALVPAFLAVIALHPALVITSDILALLVGIGAVAVVGIIDDWRELSAGWQLGGQVAAVVAFLWLGGIAVPVINNPLGSPWVLGTAAGTAVAGIWLLVVMNTVNWLDGLDGLGAIVLTIGFITLAIVSTLPHVNQPPLAILSVIGAAVTGAFLIFNMPPATALLGSGGVYGMAFALGGLSVLAGGKMATAALVLGLPLIDAVWVLWQRLRARHPVTRADTRHLHHTLLRAGYTPSQVLGLYAGITAVFAVLALTLTGPLRIINIPAVVAVAVLVVIHAAGREEEGG